MVIIVYRRIMVHKRTVSQKWRKKNLLYKHRERVIQHLCKFLRNEMHSSKCHIPSL